MVLAATPLSQNVGVEIRGLDLRNSMTPRVWQRLFELWRRHHVIVFRDQQDMSDLDLLLFSGQIGKLDPAPNFDTEKSSVDGFPDIAVVSNIRENGHAVGGLGDGELGWHSDMTYVTEPPVACALLARELPPAGGATYFLSLQAAYDSLPLGLRNSIRRYRLFHDAGYTSAGTKRLGTVKGSGCWHSLAISDPLSGRPSLFLGRHVNRRVEGLEPDAGASLLDELWAHAVQQVHIVRHDWRPGDLVVWNNIAVMHRRDAFDPAARRRLHRTQIRRFHPQWELFTSVA